MAEQREIMSKCYEERRAVADEQSKVSSTQKVSKEKELRETERLVKVCTADHCTYTPTALNKCCSLID